MPKLSENSINRTLLQWILFLALSFVSTGVSAQNTKPASLKILFIGNSYTHMNSMPKLFEKIAVSKGMNVDVEMDARSSHTFEMHSKRMEMFEHIRAKQWDYVILQGFSRELAQSIPVIEEQSTPYIRQIKDSIMANNACTEILLYMTWGYKEGYRHQEHINTYEKMTDSVRRGYFHISNKFNFPIVPVGAVYKSLRGQSDINLYEGDFQHPNPRGSYLIACSFYSAIFKSTPFNAYYKDIEEEEAIELQRISSEYVLNHLHDYKLDRDVYSLKYFWTNKGKLGVKGETNFPDAKSVQWDFGDGALATEQAISHVYKRLRPVTITLTIEDDCGTRIFQDALEFNEIPEPEPDNPAEDKIRKLMRRAKKRKRFG